VGGQESGQADGCVGVQACGQTGVQVDGQVDRRVCKQMDGECKQGRHVARRVGKQRAGAGGQTEGTGMKRQAWARGGRCVGRHAGKHAGEQSGQACMRADKQASKQGRGCRQGYGVGRECWCAGRQAGRH
jgi:hypothetical protein